MGNCCLVGRSGKVIFVRWGRSVTHAQATPGVLWGRSTTGTVTRSLYSAPVSRLMSGGEDEFWLIDVNGMLDYIQVLCGVWCHGNGCCGSSHQNLLSYYIVLCYIIFPCILYYVTYYIILYHIISYHIISYHIISYHIISYYIISYLIISYYIISYHIISYHIISYHIISYHII